MPATILTRRHFLAMSVLAASASVLAACGGASTPTSAPAPKAEAKPATAPAAPAQASPVPTPSPTPRVLPIAKKTGNVDLKIWFHWGAATGDFAQEMINNYNTTQGEKDKAYVSIETIRDVEYRQKLTAARLAGTTPDVYHISVPIKELLKNEVLAEMPKEEQDYVKANYQAGPVERMTLGGKIWGYPTEFQAQALIYRKSYLKEAGLEVPKTVQEAREAAKKLTRTEGGKKTRYGFTEWYDTSAASSSHIYSLIYRFGGTPFTFEGDRCVKIDIASPEAIQALGWWRGFVDDGVTQAGEMPYVDAWQNGLAVMSEMEPWHALINLRSAGKNDIYEDLGVASILEVPGKEKMILAGGWHLVADKNSKQSDVRWRFMAWMMHKPDMPMSRFIVEKVGSMPAPTDYPIDNIPGWTKDMIEGYAKIMPPLARATPTRNILGAGELQGAVRPAMEAIFLKKGNVEDILKELNPKLNEIIKRTEV